MLPLKFLHLLLYVYFVRIFILFHKNRSLKKLYTNKITSKTIINRIAVTYTAQHYIGSTVIY